MCATYNVFKCTRVLLISDVPFTINPTLSKASINYPGYLVLVNSCFILKNVSLYCSDFPLYSKRFRFRIKSKYLSKAVILISKGVKMLDNVHGITFAFDKRIILRKKHLDLLNHFRFKFPYFAVLHLILLTIRFLLFHFSPLISQFKSRILDNEFDSLAGFLGRVSVPLSNRRTVFLGTRIYLNRLGNDFVVGIYCLKIANI